MIYLRVTHEIPTRKSFGTTKYLEEKNVMPTKQSRAKISDPRNTHEKKIWTHEIPTKKISDPRNNHEEKFCTRKGTMARDPRDPRWHETHRI